MSDEERIGVFAHGGPVVPPRVIFMRIAGDAQAWNNPEFCGRVPERGQFYALECVEVQHGNAEITALFRLRRVAATVIEEDTEPRRCLDCGTKHAGPGSRCPRCLAEIQRDARPGA